MPESIIEIIDQYPEVINKTIDLTFDKISQNGQTYKPGDPDPILNPYVVLRRYISPRLAFRKIEGVRPTLAFIVGVDGEYPIRRESVQFSLELIGSTKIARARLLTEEDFDILRDAELHLRANETAVYDAFVREYVQIPAYLTATIVRLCTVLIMQLYATATSLYIDPETRLGFEISYLNQVPATNRPLPLAGANLWSAVTTAKPLENLRDHFNAYYANVFRLPDSLAMPAIIADYMLNATDTRVKIARMKGLYDTIAPEVLASLPRPTVEDCRTWLQNEMTSAAQSGLRMPEFIVTDAFFYTEDITTGETITKPYLTNDSYIFMTQGIIEGAYVPTATNNYASTFAVVTELISRAPKREKISVDSRFLAACSDPRYLGWRKVI
jgi:hypothetical protein